MFSYLEKQATDIWLLQETLVTKESTLKALASKWKGHSYWSPAIGKQGGVAIFIPNSFTGGILQ